MTKEEEEKKLKDITKGILEAKFFKDKEAVDRFMSLWDTYAKSSEALMKEVCASVKEDKANGEALRMCYMAMLDISSRLFLKSDSREDIIGIVKRYLDEDDRDNLMYG